MKENYNDTEINSSCEGYSEDTKLEGENINETEQSQQKSRKCKKDLTMTLPSRRTILRYLEDASYVSLKYLAQQLLNNDELVITIGLDNTRKAAGHKSYDIKRDHIPMKGDSGQKSSHNMVHRKSQSFWGGWCNSLQPQTEVSFNFS